jgi:DNA segregation ATPase FtsK/SpoIIIE-like protein
MSNYYEGTFTLGLGLAFCGGAACIQILDQRHWFDRKVRRIEQVKAAKEAVRQGTATKEQQELDKQWSENRTLDPSQMLGEAIQWWLISHRIGRLIIEAWLLLHGALLLFFTPAAFRGEQNILAYQILIWWIFGFWPAILLYGVTLIALLIILMTSKDVISALRNRRGEALRKYVRNMIITAGLIVVVVVLAGYLGWISRIAHWYPPAWNHLIHLPSTWAAAY